MVPTACTADHMPVGRQRHVDRQLAVVTALVAALAQSGGHPELVARGLRYATGLAGARSGDDVGVDTLAVTTWVATAGEVVQAHAPADVLPATGTTAPAYPVSSPLRPRRHGQTELFLGTASVSLIAAVTVALVASVLLGPTAMTVVLRVVAVTAWGAWSVAVLAWALATGRYGVAAGWWVLAPLTAPWLAWRWGDHRKPHTVTGGQ